MSKQERDVLKLLETIAEIMSLLFTITLFIGDSRKSITKKEPKK